MGKTRKQDQDALLSPTNADFVTGLRADGPPPPPAAAPYESCCDYHCTELTSTPRAQVTVPDTPEGGVFDRLTDTRRYSGASKRRFSSEGVGLGLAGTHDDDKWSILIAFVADQELQNHQLISHQRPSADSARRNYRRGCDALASGLPEPITVSTSIAIL